MPLPPASQAITDTDFEAIEAAVKETARGRWFLEEFAQRNRHADTKIVLDAIQRLQRSVLGAESAPAVAPPPPTVIHDNLDEIERAADETRKLLGEIDAAHRRHGDLGSELEAIVAASAQAVSGVLSDADRIGEISATMRAQGIGEHICDQLDGLAGHLNTACAFHDLTGQRMQKVGVTLRLLEARVHELVKLWQAESAAVMPEKDEFLRGPAHDGEGMEQDQVDELLSIDQNHDIFWDDKAATTPNTMPEPKTAPQAAAPSRNAARSAVEKLSPEERLALFS